MNQQHPFWMLKAHQQESNWQTDPMIIHTIPFNSKQYHPNNTIAWETRPCGLWAGAKHVHTHFMPKNVINFPPYFYQNFPSLAPTSGDSKCIRKYFPRFFNQNFPHLDIFLSPFPIPFYPRFGYTFFPALDTLFVPVSDTLFIPVLDALSIPVFDTLFISVSVLALSKPFLQQPHMRNAFIVLCPVPNVRTGDYPRPRCSHALVYCALSPTSE